MVSAVIFGIRKYFDQLSHGYLPHKKTFPIVLHIIVSKIPLVTTLIGVQGEIKEGNNKRQKRRTRDTTKRRRKKDEITKDKVQKTKKIRREV